MPEFGLSQTGNWISSEVADNLEKGRLLFFDGKGLPGETNLSTEDPQLTPPK